MTSAVVFDMLHVIGINFSERASIIESDVKLHKNELGAGLPSADIHNC